MYLPFMRRIPTKTSTVIYNLYKIEDAQNITNQISSTKLSNVLYSIQPESPATKGIRN